jgi:hypothetical protein
MTRAVVSDVTRNSWQVAAENDRNKKFSLEQREINLKNEQSFVLFEKRSHLGSTNIYLPI